MFLSIKKTILGVPLAALMLVIAAPQPAAAGEGHRGPSYGHSERQHDWRDRQASRNDWRDRGRGHDRRDWRDGGYGNHPCDRLARRDWDSRKDRKHLKRACSRAHHGRGGYDWWQGRWGARWESWESKKARHPRPHPHRHRWHPHRY